MPSLAACFGALPCTSECTGNTHVRRLASHAARCPHTGVAVPCLARGKARQHPCAGAWGSVTQCARNCRLWAPCPARPNAPATNFWGCIVPCDARRRKQRAEVIRASTAHTARTTSWRYAPYTTHLWAHCVVCQYVASNWL